MSVVIEYPLVAGPLPLPLLIIYISLLRGYLHMHTPSQAEHHSGNFTQSVHASRNSFFGLGDVLRRRLVAWTLVLFL